MRPFPAVVRAVRWLASLRLHLCPALRAPIASVRYTVVLPVLPVLPVPVITGNTDLTYSTCACVNNSEQQQQQQQK